MQEIKDQIDTAIRQMEIDQRNLEKDRAEMKLLFWKIKHNRDNGLIRLAGLKAKMKRLYGKEMLAAKDEYNSIVRCLKHFKKIPPRQKRSESLPGELNAIFIISINIGFSRATGFELNLSFENCGLYTQHGCYSELDIQGITVDDMDICGLRFERGQVYTVVMDCGSRRIEKRFTFQM